MPVCLAPGCTTGYKSNSEKVRCFQVPKDPELKDKWQKALRRPKTLVQNQVVCVKHFLDSDIIRVKELYGKDNQVVGVSPLARVKLRDGAVPYWFPWVESAPSTCHSDTLCSNESLETSGVSTTISEDIQNSSGFIDTSMSASELNDSISPNDSIGVREIYEEKEACEPNNFTFDDVSNGVMTLPLSWTRVTNEENNCYWTSFSKVSFCKRPENGGEFAIIQKEIRINDNLEIKINVLGKPIDPSAHGIPRKVVSLKMLEETIILIQSLKICRGYLLPTTIEHKRGNLSNPDITGTVRNESCVLLTHSIQCKLCHSAKRTLLRREKRKTSKNEKDNRRIPSKLGKKDIPNLQRKLKRKNQQIRKLIDENKKLKKELNSTFKRMAQLENEQILSTAHRENLSQTQIDLIEQILNAAKCKSARGRRYKEDWMMLCMLLHMRSPAGYNFLRSNNILPLPAISTIRK